MIFKRRQFERRVLDIYLKTACPACLDPPKFFMRVVGSNFFGLFPENSEFSAFDEFFGLFHLAAIYCITILHIPYSDPRIAGFKEADRQEKLAKKKAKQDAARQRKEAEEKIQKEAEEKARLEKEEQERLEKEKNEKMKNEREALKKALKNERRLLKNTCKR